MFWSRNKAGDDKRQDAGRPADQAPDQAEQAQVTMPPHRGRMPPGFVYGYMGDVPLHRPLKFQPQDVREIFRGVPPDMLAKVGEERLARIARSAYIMAEGQIHGRTALASLGVDDLTRRFAATQLARAVAALSSEKK